MKIGVISDTHGSLKAWRKVMKEYFADADMIIHAGDLFEDFDTGEFINELAKEMNGLRIPFIVARGNCDAETDLALADFPVASPYAFAQINSVRILVNHGKKMTEEDMIELANKWNIDIFVSGHTHKPKLMKKGGVVLLNPGSPSMGKREQSVGMIYLNDKGFKIKIFNIETGDEIKSGA